MLLLVAFYIHLLDIDFFMIYKLLFIVFHVSVLFSLDVKLH